MVQRSMMAGLLVIGAGGITSPEHQEASRTVEDAIAGLIGRTNELRNCRVLYEIEDDPTTRLELLYEHPTRAKLILTSADGEDSVFSIIDGVMHVRGKGVSIDLDMNPRVDELRSLDQQLFQILVDERPRARVSILNLEQARLMFMLPSRDSRSEPVLSWLDTMARYPDRCRLEGDEIAYRVDGEPRAYVSQGDGFPTRLRRKDGTWLLRRKLETDVDLAGQDFEVSEPEAGSKDSTHSLADQMSEDLIEMYRFCVYERLVRHPDLWSAEDLETSWKGFHAHRIEGSRWGERFEQGLGKFAQWVRENEGTDGVEARIAEWKEDVFETLNKGREEYLKSLELPEGRMSRPEAAVRALAIEREAARDVYGELVEEAVERRVNEFISSRD